ncbi:MAG: hypothetical protein WCQ47_04170 [bacterium]
MLIFKQIVLILLIVLPSFSYAQSSNDEQIKKINNEVAVKLKTQNSFGWQKDNTVKMLVRVVNHQVLLDMSKDDFNRMLLELEKTPLLEDLIILKNDPSSGISSLGSSINTNIKILSLLYGIDDYKRGAIKALIERKLISLDSILKMDKITFWEKMEALIEVLEGRAFLKEQIVSKEKQNTVIVEPGSDEAVQNIIKISGLDDNIKNQRNVAFLLNNNISLDNVLVPNLEKSQVEKRIKKLTFSELLYLRSEDKVKFIKDIMFLYDVKLQEEKSLILILDKFSLSEVIYNMEWNILKQLLVNYSIEEKQQQNDVGLIIPEGQKIEDDVVVFSGKPVKGYTVNPSVISTTDHYNDYDDKTFQSKLRAYILASLETSFPGPENELKRLNELKTFMLNSTRAYAEKAMEEMYMELFEEGELLPLSIEFLSDRTIRSRLVESLGISRVPGGIKGLCAYLRELMSNGRGVWNIDNAKAGWEESLNEVEQSIEIKPASNSENKRKGVIMLEQISKKIKNNVPLEKIVKKDPILVAEENLVDLLDEVKQTPKKSTEILYLEKVSDIIEIKLSNRIAVSQELQDTYKEVANYLNSGDKDKKIFNDRLAKNFNIQANDIKKIVNKLVSAKGVISIKAAEVLFGTKRREFKDGLYSMMKDYRSNEELRDLFLFLNVLVINKNPLISFECSPKMPVAEYLSVILSGDNEWILNDLKSYNMQEELNKRLTFIDTEKTTSTISAIKIK